MVTKKQKEKKEVEKKKLDQEQKKDLERYEKIGKESKDKPQIKTGKSKKKWFKKYINKERLQKNKKVAVIYLRNIGITEFFELESRDGMFQVNGRIYHESKDCIYRLKDENIPVAIIPEWSMTPIGTRVEKDRGLKEKFAEYQDLVLKAIRYAELSRTGGADFADKKFNVRQVILYVILAIVGGSVLTNYF